jgi:hypothetical protein
LLLLEEQDRGYWDQQEIQEALVVGEVGAGRRLFSVSSPSQGLNVLGSCESGEEYSRPVQLSDRLSSRFVVWRRMWGLRAEPEYPGLEPPRRCSSTVRLPDEEDTPETRLRLYAVEQNVCFAQRWRR